MPKIDAVADLSDKSHNLGSQNIFIEICVFVFDNEYRPDDEECLLAGFHIVQEGCCQDE